MTEYVRFQSDQISSRTGKPQGFFAAAHFLKQGNALSEPERARIAEIEEWFKTNVPDPPFYEEGSEIRAVTWFKSERKTAIEKARAMVQILRQHGVKMQEVRQQRPGQIVYEDEFQIAVANQMPQLHNQSVEGNSA